MRELTSGAVRLKRITTGSVLAMLLLAGTASATEPDPMYGRIRAGLRREAVAFRVVPTRPLAAVPVRVVRTQSRPAKTRHSLWRGAAIGAGIGALIGGFVWGPSLCSSNDSECTAITVPAGLGVGAGIGAAVGAIVQAVAR